MTTVASTDIETRLKQEVLAPFVLKFRTFSAVALSLWPLNYFAAFLVSRYAMQMDGAEAAFAAIAGMLLLGIVDSAVFGILLASTVREAGTAFLQLFPQGSIEYAGAMRVLASEKSSAAKSLYKSLILRAESGPDQPDTPAPRNIASTPVRQETGYDDLIDLNASQETPSRNR